MYITPSHANRALHKMRQFHHAVEAVFDSHNMPFKDNLGRRNIVMSQAQEEFFAQALADTYGNVVSDGRTGQPDIVIGELGKELECKLASRGKNGQIQFQCDENTMAAKGSLDYLYVVACPDFEEFAVLHFMCLTPDDFFPASPGSKGRARMKKWSAMNKCNIVWGSVDDIREERIAAQRQGIFDEKLKHDSKLSEIDAKIEATTATRRLEQLVGMREREIHRHLKKLNKLEQKLQMTLDSDSSYRINTEKLVE